ncbi:hypothetical protein N7603_05700 [Acholeplasma vituli]|uniref:Uridine kinase n=1 Tax=Paracholeplasma vituli TaxID=69473 RepID=A0ABT2PW11_9MOLU|nr:hypothetical protein [Paracholeplasma vituli]MCU0105146.1 hypothetical protein [Paracholeplasma vituli]
MSRHGLRKIALNSLFKPIQPNTYNYEIADHLRMVRFRKMLSRGDLRLYVIDEEGELGLSSGSLMKFLKVNDYQRSSNGESIPYIIVNSYQENLLKVLSKMDALLESKPELWIAIDGYACAGKTTLANLLSQIYEGSLFHTDDFFKKPIITEDPLTQYGANIDFHKINQTVIEPIHNQASVHYQPFDFKTHKHLEHVIIPYSNIHIFEGAYSLHPHLEAPYDLKVFYDISRLKQYYKIYERNGFKRLKKFITIWIPNERKYVKALKIKEKANLYLK